MYDKNFFEAKFSDWTPKEGNAWRFWRASQKNRMNIILKEIGEYLNNNKDIIKVCEIGCGTGDFTELYYKENCMEVLGIDISDNAINICKNRFKKYSTIDFQSIEVLAMSEERKFDLVICMDILHYYDDNVIEAILDKMLKIKEGDGKYVLAIPLSDDDSDGNNFLNIVDKKMQIKKVGYINNHFYTKTIENKLIILYDAFTVQKYGGKLGILAGRFVRRLLASQVLLDLISYIGSILKKRTNSHIYIIAE